MSENSARIARQLLNIQASKYISLLPFDVFD